MVPEIIVKKGIDDKYTYRLEKVCLEKFGINYKGILCGLFVFFDCRFIFFIL